MRVKIIADKRYLMFKTEWYVKSKFSIIFSIVVRYIFDTSKTKKFEIEIF